MPSRARSLAEDLRHRSDAALAEFFRLRSNLRHPVPRSFADLALRANSAAATITALDDLTRAELTVLEAASALSIGGRFTGADLATALGQPPDSVLISAPIDSLMTRALLWGEVDDLRVPSAVREAMGREPCGLDSITRPHLAVADTDQVRRLLVDAPSRAVAQLDEAIWGPPTLPPATTPEDMLSRDWLVANGLVIKDEIGNHLVPREVALALRDGRLIRDPDLAPPSGLHRAPAQPEGIQRLNGHAADQFLRMFDRLLTQVTHDDVHRQVNGAVQARDWDRLLTTTGLSAADAGLIIDLAWTTECLDVDPDRALRPTTQYEHRAEQDRASRWATLAHAWLRSSRTVASSPDRVLAINGSEDTPTQRALVLTAADRVPRPSVRAWLAWHRPRRTPSAEFIAAVLTESDVLGLTHSPESSHRDPAGLARYIGPLLPDLTERVVLQADLTATALGPLDRSVELRLAQLADPESGGAAAVYRFTPESVSRGLAGGLTADTILVWLEDVAATPVPQSLRVLIQDVARAMPRISVIGVQSVITCDPEVADAMMADTRLSDLGLRRVAPGVITAQSAPTELHRRLRERGHLVDRPDSRPRAVHSDRPPSRKQFPEPTAERIVQSLRQVEFREHPEEHPPPSLPLTEPEQTQERLFTASVKHERIWLDFSESDGTRQTHLIEPLSMVDADVCAFDVTVGEIRMIPLARIVGLAPSQG